MKTVMMTTYGGPEVLTLAEADKPTPGSGELLLKMHTASVAKPDHLMRTGAYPWTKGILPFYPGLCGTAVIAGLGEGVTGLAEGQPVFVDHPIACGCYSEYKTCPAASVTPLPAGIDLRRAAVMNNHVIAWSLLTHVCQPAEGKTLYIKGAAGALGTAIVQLAPVLGISVIASASTAEKCAYLEKQGAAHVFCYKQRDEVEAVMEYTAGQGVDYVMDQCAGPDFKNQIPMLTRCGTIIIYNTLNGFPQDNIIQLLTDNFAKCPGVRAFSFHLHDGRTEEIQALRREVFDMLLQGKVKPHIGAEFSQRDVVQAHRALDSGKVLGSIVLKVSE